MSENTMTQAQRELCEKLEAPSYTADDYMVMAEAANEIRYLSAQSHADSTEPISPESYDPCAGMNCGCTDGKSHSPECFAEHAATIAGGVFVKHESK